MVTFSPTTQQTQVRVPAKAARPVSRLSGDGNISRVHLVTFWDTWDTRYDVWDTWDTRMGHLGHSKLRMGHLGHSHGTLGTLQITYGTLGTLTWDTI